MLICKSGVYINYNQDLYGEERNNNNNSLLLINVYYNQRI